MIAMSLASDVYVITWEDLDTFDHGSLVKHVSLQNLFESPCTVDAAYRYYCDVNAKDAYDGQNLPVLRSLQKQERTYALAGLMARRYDSMAQHPAKFFAKNMQATAQRNTEPMTLNNAVKMLSNLDLRRGTGTFTDFIKIPEDVSANEPARSFDDFLPRYDDTWQDFLSAVNNNELKLPAIPII